MGKKQIAEFWIRLWFFQKQAFRFGEVYDKLTTELLLSQPVQFTSGFIRLPVT